jgi:aryl-alcohol dehydrogenase-like predicted oxidoreductase
MDYHTLGRSGLKVSRACLGAMNFGTSADAPTGEQEARTIIDAFLDAGHNFIDTANGYTGGQSEQVVGRALKGRRDTVVLATKGFGPIGEGPNDRGLSRRYLERALDASLKRLDVDYIDLYQCHRPDPDTPIEETMDTLAGFVRAGKVRYIGCSEFSGSQIVEAQWAAARQNGVPFTALQPQYSLIARDIEADILPACGRHGLGTLIWSPLGGGVLTGKYLPGQAPGADTRFGRNPGRGGNRLNDRNFAIVDAVKQVAAELATTPTAVAIAWCLTRNHITSVIMGPRTLQQLHENLVGFELKLPAEAVKLLSNVSRPGAIGLEMAARRAA